MTPLATLALAAIENAVADADAAWFFAPPSQGLDCIDCCIIIGADIAYLRERVPIVFDRLAQLTSVHAKRRRFRAAANAARRLYREIGVRGCGSLETHHAVTTIPHTGRRPGPPDFCQPCQHRTLPREQEPCSSCQFRRA